MSFGEHLKSIQIKACEDRKKQQDAEQKAYLIDLLSVVPAMTEPKSEEEIEEKAQELFEELKTLAEKTARECGEYLDYDAKLTDKRILERVRELFREMDEKENPGGKTTDVRIFDHELDYGNVTLTTHSVQIGWWYG
jgi:small-conductance mechanosensitive channel